ncbi:1276_t:CDS:2, partial [Funneliformis caledonium]
LKYLLQNVLDSKTIQTAQQIRPRNYDDKIQYFNRYMGEDEDAEDFDERSSSKSNPIIEAEN